MTHRPDKIIKQFLQKKLGMDECTLVMASEGVWRHWQFYHRKTPKGRWRHIGAAAYYQFKELGLLEGEAIKAKQVKSYRQADSSEWSADGTFPFSSVIE